MTPMRRRYGIKSMILEQFRRGIFSATPLCRAGRAVGRRSIFHAIPARRIRSACFGFAALLAAAQPTLAAQAGPADESAQANPALGREFEVGIAAHDLNGDGGREKGVDLALVLRGERLEGIFWQTLLSPRPHIGINIHDQFKTSSLYAGLTWSAVFGEVWYISADFGGAIHNGKLDRTTRDRVALGSRVLFREALEVGVRISERWRTGIRADHMSNADLATPNDGVTTLGLMLTRDF